MNKNILTFLLITLVIAGCSWNPFRRQTPTPTPTEVPTPTQTASQIREALERDTGLSLPTLAPSQSVTGTSTDSAETTSPQEIVLNAVDGDARGYATLVPNSTGYKLTILADMPDVEAGHFYQVWLVQGEQDQPDFNQSKIARLRAQKGGYLLEYTSRQTYPDNAQVIVSREQTDDNTMEAQILSGSF